MDGFPGLRLGKLVKRIILAFVSYYVDNEQGQRAGVLPYLR